jgi:hypothetical protein
MNNMLKKGPNLSVLFFLTLPVISIIIIIFGLTGNLNIEGTAKFLRITEVIIIALIGITTALILAARLKIAPYTSVISGIIIIIIAYIFGLMVNRYIYTEEYAYMVAGKAISETMPYFWLVLFGSGLAFLSSQHFQRPPDMEKLPGWILTGLALLLRKDKFALIRVISGIFLLILALIIAFCGKLLMPKLMLLGAIMIIGSVFNIHDEENPL